MMAVLTFKWTHLCFLHWDYFSVKTFISVVPKHPDDIRLLFGIYLQFINIEINVNFNALILSNELNLH